MPGRPGARSRAYWTSSRLATGRCCAGRWLRSMMASDVATNPFTGQVTTVIRRSRFNPNTVLPDGTLRWVPLQ
jgi:hypothetical protein